MTDHFTFKGQLYGRETVIFGDVAGEHPDTCSFWQGGLCDCTPEARAALEREHDPDCDWLNAYSGHARCSCRPESRVRNALLRAIALCRRYLP